jgi:hypothetical protein
VRIHKTQKDQQCCQKTVNSFRYYPNFFFQAEARTHTPAAAQHKVSLRKRVCVFVGGGGVESYETLHY